MQRGDNNERMEFTFIWKVENFSYCFDKKGVSLDSPLFIVDTLERTKWQLKLCPRGGDDESKQYSSLFLRRVESNSEQCKTTINYELALLSADGSPLVTFEDNKHFLEDHTYGAPDFVKREDIFGNKKAMYLPRDILTVRCRIWKNNGNLAVNGLCFARTRILVERITLNWVIDDIQQQLNQSKIISLNFASQPMLPLTMTLLKTGLKISISQMNINQRNVLTCKISVNSCEPKEFKHCFKVKSGEQVWNISPFTYKQLLAVERKEGWKLKCECAISVGDVFNQIEGTFLDIPPTKIVGYKEYIENFGDISPTAASQTKTIVTHETTASQTETTASQIEITHSETATNPSDSPLVMNGTVTNKSLPDNLCCFNSPYTLIQGMQFMYKKRILCDFNLRSCSETFPVHKAVLSARSPVFWAMFNSDMKEGASDSLHIPDINADTLRLLLLFIYTDTMEEVQWEDAYKLYFAADKYAILLLKEKCSFILKNNLCVSNACDILALADMHHDDDLKIAVQDYIFNHDQEIFCSDAWKKFEANNSLLAVETMRTIYLRKLKS